MDTEPTTRQECCLCNHSPVCKDSLKTNLDGDCPYYEPEDNKAACTVDTCRFYNVPDISEKSISVTLLLIDSVLSDPNWTEDAKDLFQEMADFIGAIEPNAK